MKRLWPRCLLIAAALILGAGGVIHALAFPKALAVLDAVVLPPFYQNSFRALWLIDSASLVGVAIILALIAARPSVATRGVVLLMSLIPAAITGLVYYFVGSFPPAHTLALATALIVIAGTQFPGSRAPGPT